ncbi:MAG: hypothetical protein IKU36_04140 [Bacteroidales bacterium]|nr:hypothetical protein [Bacteroidales bacterium]
MRDMIFVDNMNGEVSIIINENVYEFAQILLDNGYWVRLDATDDGTRVTYKKA